MGILYMLGIFLSVFLPFYLLAKLCQWGGNRLQEYAREQLEARGIQPDFDRPTPPKRRGRKPHLRLVK